MMWSHDAADSEPGHLARLAAPAWAWEFLRRNAEYRHQAAQWARPSVDTPLRYHRCKLERKEVEVPARRWGLLVFRECRSRRQRGSTRVDSHGSARCPSCDDPRAVAG